MSKINIDEFRQPMNCTTDMSEGPSEDPGGKDRWADVVCRTSVP